LSGNQRLRRARALGLPRPGGGSLTKAILVSFFLHAAAVALALYLHAGPLERKEVSELDPADDFEVQAPLGHVFVQEAPPEAAGAPDRKGERAAASGMSLPGEGKEGARTDSEAASGPAGSPEGEAQPVGRIEPAYPPVSRR